MRAFITADPDSVIPFLQAYEYPNTGWIDLNELRQATIIQVISEGGDLAGFVWFTWANSQCSVLSIHACIRPEWHSRWITRRVLTILRAYAELLGALAVEAHLPKEASDLFSQVLVRLGFQQFNGRYYLVLNDGIPKTTSEAAKTEDSTS